MKYSYSSITQDIINYGNYFVDYSTKLITRKILGKEALEWNTNKGKLPDHSDCDFAIVPGCTTLNIEDNKVLDQIDPSKLRVYNIGAAFSCDKNSKPDISRVDKFVTPIAIRDTFTQKRLEEKNKKYVLVGCPTLFLPNNGCCDKGYILFSLGRLPFEPQVKAIKKLMNSGEDIKVLCHEKSDYDFCLKHRVPGVMLLPNLGIQESLRLYKEAQCIITGRLHGALPGISFRKPVYYFGTNNSRISLLDYLKVKVHSYKNIEEGVSLASMDYDLDLVDELKDEYLAYVKWIKDRES